MRGILPEIPVMERKKKYNGLFLRKEFRKTKKRRKVEKRKGSTETKIEKQ